MDAIEAGEGQGIRPPGRDEMNLAEFPITLLTERRAKGVNTIEFKDGQGTLTVIGSEAYGLPTAVDADVIIGLIQLTKLRTNFTDPCVPFTRYELLRILDWPDRGRSYHTLSESLDRWTTVTLKYNNAWWDNKTGCRVDATFHILESVILVEKSVRRAMRAQGRQQDLPFSAFTWNKVFFQSCQADNLKHLDLDLYFSLKSAVSKQMYRFLDKRFYRRTEWIFDLAEFAHEHVGLGRNYADNGKLKEKLGPALKELEAIGYLKPMGREERYKQVQRGRWTIALSRNREKAEPAAPASPSLAPGPTGLAKELVERGVTLGTARELVEGYPGEDVAGKIEVFDWLAEKKDKRVSKSPAGYLVESIRANYAAPAGFESKAERAGRQEAEREKRRQEAEAKKRQRAEQAREAAEQARIKKHWDSLGKAEQEQLDREAVANANPELLRSYEATKGGPIQRMMLRFIREAHIRMLLGIPSASPAAE
jgi:Replication initiator protein A